MTESMWSCVDTSFSIHMMIGLIAGELLIGGFNFINFAVPETKAAIIATSNFGDALLLILALCFHSVFEGIAIGVAGQYLTLAQPLQCSLLRLRIQIMPVTTST